MLADVLAFVIAVAATNSTLGLADSWYQLLITLVLWVLVTNAVNLYDWDSVVIDSATIHEVPRLVLAMAVAVGAIFILEPDTHLSAHRHSGVVFAVVLLAAMLISRSAVRLAILRRFGPERALIVGHGLVADLVSRKLRTHHSYGTEVVGYLGDPGYDEGEDGMLRAGDISELPEVSRTLKAERVIIAFSMFKHDHLLDVIRASRMLGLKVSIVPRFFEVLNRSLVLDELEGMALLSLGARSGTRLGLVAKRGIDILGALIGFVVLSPVLAIVAIAVKLDSPGPVIFSQTRIGRHGKPFRIRKFRTMIVNAAALNAEVAALSEIAYPLLKIPEDRDPRLTRAGRILRKTMLDEAPQLWNVLLGQMSLVGPRPLEPQDDAEVVEWQRARLAMPPGITGPWQALGRHAIPFPEMLTLDCLYVSDWSLWQDIRLLVRTAQVVLLRSRPH